MAAEAYIDDVAALVEVLTAAELAPSIRPLAPESDDPGRVEIEVFVGSDDLRPALAVQQLLQLCVDSAAIVVEQWDSPSAFFTRGEIESKLNDRVVELTIIRLSDGSFLARFSINPKTKKGRKRLLAIAGVTITALGATAVLPPIALTVLGGLPFLAGALKPDPEEPKETGKHEAPTVPKVTPLKTIDANELTGADVRVTIAARPTAERPVIHRYEMNVDGPLDARQAFLARVHGLEGVEAQSRYLGAGENAGRGLTVWSAQAHGEDEFCALAADTGVELSDFTYERTHH